MSDDKGKREDRSAILARRRNFAVVALSGIALPLAASCEPSVCLKMAPPPSTTPAPTDAPDAGPPPSATTPPTASAPPTSSAAAPGGGVPDGGATDGGKPEPRPVPCLSVRPPQDR